MKKCKKKCKAQRKCKKNAKYLGESKKMRPRPGTRLGPLAPGFQPDFRPLGPPSEAPEASGPAVPGPENVPPEPG